MLKSISNREPLLNEFIKISKIGSRDTMLNVFHDFKDSVKFYITNEGYQRIRNLLLRNISK